MPNGVFIGRPPANSLPSRAVWQAMQSPARARYSPLRDQSAAFGVAAAAPIAATRRSAARNEPDAGSSVFKVRGICTIASQFGSLPQASGIGRLPCGANDGSAGAGRDESQAATALTSSSVSRPATICMQSGAAAVRVP